MEFIPARVDAAKTVNTKHLVRLSVLSCHTHGVGTAIGHIWVKKYLLQFYAYIFSFHFWMKIGENVCLTRI